MRKFVVVLLVLFTCVSCELEAMEISIEQFREYVALPMGTVIFTKYHGVREDRVYISVHRMSSLGGEWVEKVYWVEKSKLSPEEISSLESSQSK